MRCAEFGAEQAEQAAQHEVEQNVGGLADDHQPLRAPGFDQLRQPRIVDVTGEIAGLHPRLPVDRRQQEKRQDPAAQLYHHFRI